MTEMFFMAQPGIALQMYSLREDMHADFEGTYRKVAAIGYRAVEFAGYGGLDATAMRGLLAELGMNAVGAHVGWNLLQDSLESEVEFNLAVGNRDIVCPALPQDLRSDEAGFHRAAAALNQVGRRCRELGARFSYHSHNFEFRRFGDRTGMDIILGETDPANVNWEPDIYWIAYANEDPIAWLGRTSGRWPLVHIKDMTHGPTPTFAEIGEGRLDFGHIFASTGQAEQYIVEQDRCARQPLESVALSFRHLKEWGRM